MHKSAKRVFESESGADRATWLGLLLFTGALMLVSLAAIVVMSVIQYKVGVHEPIRTPFTFWVNSVVLFASFVFLWKRLFLTAICSAALFLLLQITTVVQFNDAMVQRAQSHGVLTDAFSATRVVIIALVTIHTLYVLGGLVVMMRVAVTKDVTRRERLYPLLVFYWRFVTIVWLLFFATILFL